MKKALLRNRHALLWLTLGLLLALCVVGSFQVHERAQWQAQINRDLVDAVTRDHVETVQELLREGADPNARQLPDEAPPTFWESLKANFEYLWPHQHSAPQDMLPTALLLAVQCSDRTGKADPKLVQALLDKGADPNLSSILYSSGETEPRTPLALALQQRRADIVQMLLDKGANVSDQGKYGNAALIMSARNKQMIQLLLLHGAKIFTANDAQGAALLTYVCTDPLANETNDSISIVGMILARGVSINAKDEDGETALITAADSYVYEANSREGSDPDDSNRQLPLVYPRMMDYLMKRGADVKAKDKWGRTALVIASESRDPKAILLLLAHGADINARDKYGRTALMWAVEMGQTTTARVLLDHGADVTARDVKGHTALDRARSGTFDPNDPYSSLELKHALMRLLQQHGAAS